MAGTSPAMTMIMTMMVTRRQFIGPLPDQALNATDRQAAAIGRA
jgi:hypothetical protein